MVAMFRRGLVWSRAHRPPAASRGFWASAKRGNEYLRKLPIHGAPAASQRRTRHGAWPMGQGIAKGLRARGHQNVAVVALANKLARIAWAGLRRGENFAAKGASLAA